MAGTEKEAVLLDLDQTLVDSHIAAEFRRTGRWTKVKELIPSFVAYDGVNSLIDKLRSADMQLAIVTAAPSMYAEIVIDKFGFDPDVIVAYHDTKAHKPDPEPFALALERLGAVKAKAWAVGDQSIDIQATNDLGIISVAATWGASDVKELIGADPDLVFDTPNALGDFLVPRTAPLERGSVRDLATSLFGIDVKGGPARFNNENWFFIGETVAECPYCSNLLYGFRAPYTTTKGEYHYWALLCAHCRVALEPTNLSDAAKSELHKNSEYRPTTSQE